MVNGTRPEGFLAPFRDIMQKRDQAAAVSMNKMILDMTGHPQETDIRQSTCRRKQTDRAKSNQDQKKPQSKRNDLAPFSLNPILLTAEEDIETRGGDLDTNEDNSNCPICEKTINGHDEALVCVMCKQRLKVTKNTAGTKI